MIGQGMNINLNLPRVFSFAMESNSPDLLANYLGVVTTENMRLSSAAEHDQKFAELILEIKEGLGL